MCKAQRSKIANNINLLHIVAGSVWSQHGAFSGSHFLCKMSRALHGSRTSCSACALVLLALHGPYRSCSAYTLVLLTLLVPLALRVLSCILLCAIWLHDKTGDFQKIEKGLLPVLPILIFACTEQSPEKELSKRCEINNNASKGAARTLEVLCGLLWGAVSQCPLGNAIPQMSLLTATCRVPDLLYGRLRVMKIPCTRPNDFYAEMMRPGAPLEQLGSLSKPFTSRVHLDHSLTVFDEPYCPENHGVFVAGLGCRLMCVVTAFSQEM